MMVDHRLNLKTWAAAVMFVAGGLLCSAQTTAPANPPIFSKPADGGIMAPEVNDSLPPDNAPGKGFQGFASRQPLPPPSPTPDLNPALQQQLKQRAEWTLQTPEEIMGLQTPEEIFGLKEADADQNASPEERYLKREEKAKTATPTARLSEADSPTHEYTGIFDRPDRQDPLLSPQDQSDAGAFSHMFSDSQASPFARKNGSLAGAKGSTVNAVDKSKADQEAAAEMARFRGLIGEAPETPDATLTLPHLDASPASQPLSAFDPFGRVATTHPIDLSKPGGLTLPPEFAGYNTPPRKTKKPSWEPQAPPWLSDGLTPPTTQPVRKFY